MTDDLLQYAQSSGVGDEEPDLIPLEIRLPPEQRAAMKKSRSRPNRGRKRRYIGPYLATPPWHLIEATGYPVPHDIQCLGKVPAQWRAGPRAQAWKKAVYASHGTVCHLCKHEGADSADHLVPLALWGNQPYDTRLARPAHGVAGCPTCGIKCNSSRGHRELAIEVGNYKPPVQL